MHWDLFVRSRDIEKTAAMAGKLGIGGMGMLVPLKEKLLVKGIKAPGVDMAGGVIISGKAAKVVKAAKSVRRGIELVAVEGGDLEVNRAALSTPEVDMLLHPWKERQDCGLDHVMLKLAARKGVSVVFDFHGLLMSTRRSRVQLMNSMLEAAKLVRKFKAPFVIASGAVEPNDLRSQSDLLSFGRVLGFSDPGIKEAMSGGIVSENRKRLSGNWVMPGVELEK